MLKYKASIFNYLFNSINAIVMIVNGASRGGHYHIKATEWFTVLHGKANLVLHDMHTQERYSILLDIDEPKTIVVPPNVAHRFDAIEQNSFLLLAYTDMIYRPEDTITYEF